MMHDGGSGGRCGGKEMRQHDGLIMRQGRVGINAGNAINAGEGRNTTKKQKGCNESCRSGRVKEMYGCME